MNRCIVFLLVLLAGPVIAEVTVPMHAVKTDGAGESLGQISVSESKYGLVFSPSLKGLSPGLHGFHLHQNPSCDPKPKQGKIVPAGGAGGHYDPASANLHDTPWGAGHIGDLPALFVGADGVAQHPVLAPRLKLSDLKAKALVIHAGGDNYSDKPAALGGGGARVACGMISQ
ncbi:MAG: superoxide dismutase family protein [Gammaproteobacteria bacterium]|nr:superoxide dismutase family protein [Gammaproteobacteria bacterium]